MLPVDLRVASGLVTAWSLRLSVSFAFRISSEGSYRLDLGVVEANILYRCVFVGLAQPHNGSSALKHVAVPFAEKVVQLSERPMQLFRAAAFRLNKSWL